MKTSELTGAALDWAVAKCEGLPDTEYLRTHIDAWQFSTDWSQGGPIIEREKIATNPYNDTEWFACKGDEPEQVGPTLLVAAMRCYVASKLGDEVEVPKELK